VIARLARNDSAVLGVLAGYFIANILVRLCLPASLELDEGQQLFLAQWLAIGYDSQPPFYNWLQYGAVQIFGDTVASLSILKNTMLFGCYLSFGLAARLLLRNRQLAVVAMLGLLTIPQISFEAQRDLTHTIAVLFSACLFLCLFVRTIGRPTALNYALTGVAVGIGLLSKYNFVLLPLAAIAAILPERDLRDRLFNPRILLTLVIGAVIVAPHALWFASHLGEATGRTMGKLMKDADDSGLQRVADGLLSLAAAIAAFTLPTILLFLVAFGRTLWRSWNAQSLWSRVLGRMMLLLMAALVLLIVLGGASAIKDRWLSIFASRSRRRASRSPSRRAVSASSPLRS
jgi:4-amino-4-deoxy-L-arabinose transferase-like glycosyltransferase